MIRVSGRTIEIAALRLSGPSRGPRSQELEGIVSNKSGRNSPQRKQPKTQGSQRSQNQRSTPTSTNKTGFRPALERFSAPLLLRLHAMPRWLVPILLAVFLFVGLIASGPWAILGAVLLGVDALFVAWLSVLAWPVLTPGSRIARVVVVVALVGVTVLKATGNME